MDRRRSRDQFEAGTEAEDGPPGRPADSEINAERLLSADLGTELGESRSAATAVASTPDGTGTDADDESAASRGSERRLTVQEKVVAGSRTATTGVVSVSPLGEPAPARPAGVAGPPEPDDCQADAGD